MPRIRREPRERKTERKPGRAGASRAVINRGARARGRREPCTGPYNTTRKRVSAIVSLGAQPARQAARRLALFPRAHFPPSDSAPRILCALYTLTSYGSCASPRFLGFDARRRRAGLIPARACVCACVACSPWVVGH